MMIIDGRAEGLHAAGFPVGCALSRARGQVVTAPAPATSNRACVVAVADVARALPDNPVGDLIDAISE